MSGMALEAEAIYSRLGDDPDLGEIVEMFVEEMPDRIAELCGHVDTSDWEGLGRLAHQFKGSAGSYGFDQLTPFAARLETAVRNDQPEQAIRKAMDELIALSKKVRAGAPKSG